MSADIEKLAQSAILYYRNHEIFEICVFDIR